MSALVLAEHDNHVLNAATLSVVAAARQLGSGVDVLVAGNDCRDVALQAGRVAGIGRVLLAEAPHLGNASAENLAAQIVAVAPGYTHLLAPSTSTGKSVMPRVAALLDVAQISEIVAVESLDTFIRPIYAGNAMLTVQSTDPVKVITVRTSAFAAAGEGGDAQVVNVAAVADCGKSRVVSRDLTRSGRPDLGSAEVVIAGGRGLHSRDEFFAVLSPLADKLGAALGATRAAVDAGFVSNDLQIGQTGKIVAPRLYFAVGLSGAIQHLAGMKESRTIVAINKNPEAPIFLVADFGLVGDLFEIVPALTKALE